MAMINFSFYSISDKGMMSLMLSFSVISSVLWIKLKGMRGNLSRKAMTYFI